MLRALLALSIAVMLAAPVSAQLIPGLGGTAAAPEAETTLDETLRRAREAGVGVIIVDTEGRVLNEPPAPTTQVGPDGAGSALMEVQKQGEAFRTTLRERLDALPGSLEQLAFVLRSTSPDGRIMTYVEVLIYSAGLLFIGLLFTRFVYGPILVRRFVVAGIRAAPEGYREKMPWLAFRFVMGVIGTIVAILVAYILGLLLFPEVNDQTVQITALAVNFAFFASFVIGDLWRMILSPYLAQYRIPSFSDADARKLYVWLFFVAMLDISVLTFATWVSDFGLIYNAYAVIYGTLALVTAVLNVALVLANRRAISGAIRNGRSPADTPLLTRVISRAWAPAMILYIIFGYLELAVDLVLEQPTSVPLVAGLYATALSIIVVYGLINYGIESYFARARHMAEVNAEAEADDTQDEPAAPTSSMHTYEELARRVSGILAFIAGAYALISIWGGSAEMIEGSGWGMRLIDLCAIAFIGWIAYHAFR
ncbi:MAG: mechanosensitive ion channel family protein, partial [Pseudomonadota bacterium]